LWNNLLPGNLKILLLNNGGANIFRMIGNQSVIAKVQYFYDSPYLVNFDSLANAYLVHHQVCDSKEKFNEMVKICLNYPGCSILEVETDMEQNVDYYQNIFKNIQSK
jgi:2-succinyl-5-enolpyruvyl-6-hydroxy-3-cyclohexene-1-carboxylate synthase